MSENENFIVITERDWQNAGDGQRGWWTYQTLQSLNKRMVCLEQRPFIDKCLSFFGGVIGGFVAALGIKYLGR